MEARLDLLYFSLPHSTSRSGTPYSCQANIGEPAPADQQLYDWNDQSQDSGPGVIKIEHACLLQQGSSGTCEKLQS